MVHESALVVVSPDDSVDALIGKVRGTGARQVELLVPNGTTALQAPAGFERLQRGLAANGVAVVVFSSDSQVLQAARGLRIDTVSIEGAEVAKPGLGGQVGVPAITTPLDDDDTALLEALDSLPSARIEQPAQPADYDDTFAALDELSATMDGAPGSERAPVPNRDAELAAAFDDWGDVASGTTQGEKLPKTPSGPAARPRVRPEDITLTDEDLRRQPGAKRDRRPDSRERRPAAAPAFDQPVRQQSRTRLVGLLLIGLLLVALLAGAWWLYSQRTTVTLVPPSNPAVSTPVDGIVIPLSDGPPAEGSGAVQVQQLSFAAEATAQGQATVQTSAPVSSAAGVIQVFNKVEQQFVVQAGTDVVGVNAEGQEVVFSVDRDVTVPPAQTTVSSSAQGTSQQTTFGVAEIAITARAPGSASNLPAGSIQRVGTFGDAFNIESGAITGGAEDDTLIVGQQDVDALLGAVLTDLYNRGVEGLQAGVPADGWQIERGTISPSPEQLVGEQRYELEVVPSVGTPVEPSNPSFTLVARARFQALATPGDQPLQSQISAAVANRLQAEGRLPAAAEANITTWNWNGEELRANAEIVINRDASGLPIGFVEQLQRELVGKTRDEASQLLEQYKAQGQIGDYQLPERGELPDWSFLLDVAIAPQAGANP